MTTDLPPAIDPDDPPERWFFDLDDVQPWRSVRQMIRDRITDWIGRH